MKKLFIVSCFSVTTLMPFSSIAEKSPQTVKPWNIGVGIYTTTVNIDGSFGDEDIDFDGLNISSSYAFSDNWAIRAGYYFLENSEFSELESSGLDLAAYFGTGLATEGFKAYVGAGLFTDTWSDGSVDEDFSGFQLTGGVGYNWDIVSLELIIGVRSASDYADFIEGVGGEGDVIAVSSSLLLSARF